MATRGKNYDVSSTGSSKNNDDYGGSRSLLSMQCSPRPLGGATQVLIHMVVQNYDSGYSATIVCTWGGGSSVSITPVGYRPMLARKGRPRVQGATNAPSGAIIPSDRWDPKAVGLASRDLKNFFDLM